MSHNFTAEFKTSHPEEVGPDGKIKVCVGGGAGFIGSHIAKKLKEEVGPELSVVMLSRDLPLISLSVS
jgi:nucleoside-diphosphate-sugar epimerase